MDSCTSLAEHTSLEMTRYCRKLFSDEEAINYSCLSPFVPYALYQSAVIQLQLVKHSPQAQYEENISFFKQVLKNFNKRWLIAGEVILRYMSITEADSSKANIWPS
jgi:hypothetical protein